MVGGKGELFASGKCRAPIRHNPVVDPIQVPSTPYSPILLFSSLPCRPAQGQVFFPCGRLADAPSSCPSTSPDCVACKPFP